MIFTNDKKAFYHSSAWQKVRKTVLDRDRHECVRCKKLYGKYSPATVVHHVFHYEEYPEYALQLYVGKERNLISLCARCHNEVHPEKQRKFPFKKNPLTSERW